jgi:dCTP diphosphatase
MPLDSDATTTLAAVKAAIARFSQEREWGQFHDPKNLAMALAVEVGELMEHFRWTPNTQAGEVAADPRAAVEIRHEAADVLLLLAEFANATGIDLAAAVREKLAILENRYPVEKSRGSALKYTKL